MKYAIILGDGMADYPIQALGGKTPLSAANKPFLNKIAIKSLVGLVKTVPDGMKPGSDVANLSVLGYEPNKNYTGRSPLEAASIGINLSDTDVTLRANLVTLSDEAEYEDKTMVDYSGGEITTEEARVLISDLKKSLDDDLHTLYSGVSYRHCLVTAFGKAEGGFTPPHDITGKKIAGHLPTRKEYLDMMKKSYEILKNHPVNLDRTKRGLNPANSLWFWGEGTRPALENFESKYSLKGGMISAVDLLKGIGKLTGMRVIDVPGATGTYETNFKGKAEACVSALNGGLDFVYVHMEAPDECGHQGDLEHKIYSIERVDEVARRVAEGLSAAGERFRMLVCPDHPTPLSTRTHASDPVPFLIYDSAAECDGAKEYSEAAAKETGVYFADGSCLMKELLK